MLEFVGTAFPVSQAGVDETRTSSGLGIAELWAVLSVETSGCGSLPDRRPKILFERHVFSRLTEHRYDAGDADVSQPTAGGYGTAGASQYDRLNAAMQLDQTAALERTSWGLGQIMGENLEADGFPTSGENAWGKTAYEESVIKIMWW